MSVLVVFQEGVNIINIIKAIVQIECYFGDYPQLVTYLASQFISYPGCIVSYILQYVLAVIGREYAEVYFSQAQVWANPHCCNR